MPVNETTLDAKIARLDRTYEWLIANKETCRHALELYRSLRRIDGTNPIDEGTRKTMTDARRNEMYDAIIEIVDLLIALPPSHVTNPPAPPAGPTGQ